MSNPVFLTPVEGEDPCGPDLRWDPAFMELASAFDAASVETASIIDAERTTSSGAPSYEEILEMAEALGKRTKDLRILAIHAEACWYGRGLPAFAAAMEDLVSVAETWPDPDGGIHPRADEDDGDLGERAAPLGRLLNRVPALASTLGWGDGVAGALQVESGSTLKGVFDRWNERLGPALGDALPSKGDAWRVLAKMIPGGGDTEAAETQAEGAAPGMPPPPAADAWDTIERATELMTRQDHHSPALPMLRLLATWRNLGIVDISKTMRQSGISLEQLFDAIDQQLNPP